MRGVVTGDWHIGFQAYSVVDQETGLQSRLIDVWRSASYVVDYAIKNRADFFWFLGDLFHTNRPTPTEISFAASLFGRLERAQIPTIVIDGNHDYVAGKSKQSAASVLQHLGPNEWSYVEFIGRHPKRIDNVVAVPHGCDLNAISQFYPNNMTPRKNVLLCHTEFHGCQVGSENFMMASAVKALPKGLGPEIILSGHIHKAQTLRCAYDKRVDVIYPGSIERVSFHERDEKKEFGWFDDETLEYVSIEIPAREMVQIDTQALNEQQLVDEIQNLNVLNAIVKVNASNPRFVGGRDVIEKVLRARGVHSVAQVNLRISNSQDQKVVQTNKLGDKEIVCELAKQHVANGEWPRLLQMIEETMQ